MAFMSACRSTQDRLGGFLPLLIPLLLLLLYYHRALMMEGGGIARVAVSVMVVVMIRMLVKEG